MTSAERPTYSEGFINTDVFYVIVFPNLWGSRKWEQVEGIVFDTPIEAIDHATEYIAGWQSWSIGEVSIVHNYVAPEDEETDEEYEARAIKEAVERDRQVHADIDEEIAARQPSDLPPGVIYGFNGGTININPDVTP